MSYEQSKNQQYLKDRYHKQRQSFIDYLGGKCVVCQTTENLEFDHIDPKQKSFTIGKLWSNKDLPKVYAELDKCQLLCSKHHLEKTKLDHANGNIAHPTMTHGTQYAWMTKKCQCEPCLQAKDVFHKKRNEKRRKKDSKGKYNEEVPHGSRLSYSRGCKCLDCKAANALSVKHHNKTGVWLPYRERII